MKSEQLQEELNALFYKLLNEYCWFSKDAYDMIKIFSSELSYNEEYVSNFEKQVNDIVANNIYPKDVISNIYNSIKAHMENIEELKEVKIKDYYKKRYKVLVDFLDTLDENSINSYQFAEDTYLLKYSSLKINLNKYNCINYKDLAVVLKYDFEALSYITTGLYNFIEFEENNICKNKYFIPFIKRMQIICPALFLEKNVRKNIKKALIINTNIEITNPSEEYIKKESKKILYQLKHEKNHTFNVGFYLPNFKDLYYTGFINYIASSPNIDEIINEINLDEIMNYDFLVNLTALTENLAGKRDKKSITNLKELVYLINCNYKKYFPEEDRTDILNVINENKSNLNNQPDNDNLVYFTNEILDDIGLFKGTIKTLINYINSEEFVEEVKQQIITNYKTLKSYTLTDQQFDEISDELIFDDNYVNSIRKYLSLYPKMFTDELIFERTTMILKEKIVTMNKNDTFNFKYKNEHKKMLKKLREFDRID